MCTHVTHTTLERRHAHPQHKGIHHTTHATRSRAHKT